MRPSITPEQGAERHSLRSPGGLLAGPVLGLLVAVSGLSVERANAQPVPMVSPAEVTVDPTSAEVTYQRARSLFDAGRLEQALASVESGLSISASDPRLRFLKGVILAHAGRELEAIEVLQLLSQDFPELPEPYNNLAALRAARGELDQARIALEQAVRALPSYGLAHENLGDVYLQLAIREWGRAARLEPNSPSAAQKLDRARQAQLTSTSPTPSPGSAETSRSATPSPGTSSSGTSSSIPATTRSSRAPGTR